MRTRTATKWFGGIAATLVLTMAASVAPASAAKNYDTSKNKGSERIAQRVDTGWN